MVSYVGTQIDPDFSVSEELRRFFFFFVQAFKASEFERLPEEGFSTAVRNYSRFSDPCFTDLNPNEIFKPVYKVVDINLDSSSSFN